MNLHWACSRIVPTIVSRTGYNLGACPPIFFMSYGIGIILECLVLVPYKWLRWTSEILSMSFVGALMLLVAFIFWEFQTSSNHLQDYIMPINDFVAHCPLPCTSSLYCRNCPWWDPSRTGGQMEASRSLGVSYEQTMRKIILPQATKLCFKLC